MTMTAAGHSVHARIDQQTDGPEKLYSAWSTGEVTERADLVCLLEEAWIRAVGDRPEQLLPPRQWVQLFRAAGFFKIPSSLPDLAAPLVVYRGATEQRKRGMGWSVDIDMAREHQQRDNDLNLHGRLYKATLVPGGALAYVNSFLQEQEVIVDPTYLRAIQQIG